MARHTVARRVLTPVAVPVDAWPRQAQLCSELRLGLMVEVRARVDELEELVPVDAWPLASFKELLFDDVAPRRDVIRE